MGQTIIEKIMSNNCGKKVEAGDTVVASINIAMATDGSGPLAIDIFKKMKREKVWNPQKVFMVLDHYVPCPNAKVSKLQDMMREFCKKGNGILFEIGQGICHQLLPEKGYIKPGEIIVGGDSHSCTYGALNAFGTGIGSSDLAVGMATGKMWFRVPSTIKVIIEGTLPKDLSGKDVALYLIGHLGARGGTYRAIEFQGSGISSLDINDRMTICNMAVETGAKCGIMPFDNITKSWFEEKGISNLTGVYPDKDAYYEKTININLDNLQLQCALPHNPDRVVPVSKVEGIPINMVVIGTCTNGRLKDLEIASKILSQNDIAHGVEVLIVPASRDVYISALKKGIIEIFVDKGAVILPPGCGPCCGSSAGIPSDGENVLSTANRNFIGRMGNINSNIYLGSPLLAISSAIKGEIVNPRRLDNIENI